MPHPELSRTPPSPLQDKLKTLDPGMHTGDILKELGFSEEEMKKLATEGALSEEARKLEHPKSKL